MYAMWIAVGVLVAIDLWWVLVMRKAPAEAVTQAHTAIPTHHAKVNTQSARTTRTLAALTLLACPILWLAATCEESWMMFFDGCAAASQGILLWGFNDVIGNLAQIRHNTRSAMKG